MEDNKCDTCYKKSCSLYHMFDGMIGPTTYCPDYWPAGLTGLVVGVMYGLMLLLTTLEILIVW